MASQLVKRVRGQCCLVQAQYSHQLRSQVQHVTLAVMTGRSLPRRESAQGHRQGQYHRQSGKIHTHRPLILAACDLMCNCGSGTASDIPLLERVSEWNSATRGTTDVIEFPPAFEAVCRKMKLMSLADQTLTFTLHAQIPCKPIFFDLAFNYVTFPDMSSHLEKKSSGFVGRIGGLFGWKK